MASFLHVADARNARRIRRAGLRPSEYPPGRAPPDVPHRAVYCVPMLPAFEATFQWVRELKRWRRYRTACGVQFRIADDEPVLVGRFGRPVDRMTAAAAVAFFLRLEDVRGFEVLIPRKIAARDIVRVRTLPRAIGWRFFPEAKGAPPLWPQRGTINAARVRRALLARP